MSTREVFAIYLRYCTQKKGRYFLYLLVIISGGMTAKALPLFYKSIIDHAEQQLFAPLLGIVLGLLGVYVFSKLCTLAKIHIGGDIVCDILEEGRCGYVKSLREMDFAYHTNKSSGSLISLAKRGEVALFVMLVDLNESGVEIIMGFLLTLIVLFYYVPFIALLFLAMLFVTSIATYFLIKHNLHYRKIINAEDDYITALTVDNLVAFENIKFFGTEKREEARLRTQFIPWKKAQKRYVHTFFTIDLTLLLIQAPFIAVVLYFAIRGLTNGSLSMGTFVLIISYITLMVESMTQLIFKIRDLAKNFSDLRSFLEVTQLTPSIQDPLDPKPLKSVQGNISIKNLSFAYGEKEVLKNISLEVQRGETIALVGRSGGGKTTLTRLLMRLYTYQKGEILLDGVPITQVRQEDLRTHIGLVPQEAVLFNDTIAYNIGYPKDRASLQAIQDAAKKARLHTFIQELPERYKTIVGERGIKLSGGQKQRLAIARVLLANPSIVIFDEATSQLDSENEKLIQEAFLELTKGKTTIIIAHRLSTIMHADKIVVLDEGKIVEMGTHKDLLNTEGGLYTRLWKMQTEGIIE